MRLVNVIGGLEKKERTADVIDATAVLERQYVEEKGIWDNEWKIKLSLGMNKNFKDSAVGKAFMLAINCLKETGHNQLCNREVEVDVDKIFLTLIKDYDEVDITGDLEDLKEDYPDLWEDAQELAKAISQGNVIKFTRNER